ncbi:MAG: hypothetical protein ACP5KD_09285 [Fervidobacterium sp.]
MKNRCFVLLLFLFQVFAFNSFAQLWYVTRGLLNQDERAWGVDVDSTEMFIGQLKKKTNFHTGSIGKFRYMPTLKSKREVKLWK